MPTVGEMRVRTSFNPSAHSDVDWIKNRTAELIDYCAGLRSHVPADDSERQRLWSLAMTAYEEAAMWAVKSIT